MKTSQKKYTQRRVSWYNNKYLATYLHRLRFYNTVLNKISKLENSEIRK